MLADSLGNPVHLDDPASLGALNDFVEGFISCEARVAHILQVGPHEPSAIVQAACGALHMFAESPQGVVNARPFVDVALRNSQRASEREQRFVAAVWLAGQRYLFHPSIFDRFLFDFRNLS